MPAPPLTVRLIDLRVDVSLSSVARGDILYRGASKWNNLAAGTAGYALVSGGPGADPSWALVTTSPGGSSGQLQYNNGGAFGGLASTAVATSGNLITVTAPAATDVPLTLTGHVSQTANIFSIKNNGGTSLFNVDSGQRLTWSGVAAPSGSSSTRVLYDDGTYLRFKPHNIGLANKFFSFGGSGNQCILLPGSSGYHGSEIYIEDQSNRKAISLDSSGNFGLAGVFYSGGNNSPLTVFQQTTNNVNGFRFSHSTAGNPVTITPNNTFTGGDTNITLSLSGLGTGTVKSVAASATSVGFVTQLANAQTADAFQVLASDGTTELLDIGSSGILGAYNGLKLYSNANGGAILQDDNDFGLVFISTNTSNPTMWLAYDSLRLRSDIPIGWSFSSSTAVAERDTGISRDSAGKVVLTDGSTGAGSLVLRDAGNIETGTTTGSKIGTATTQKIGFWNATPVAQQVLATGAGATVDDVITLLQTLGLCKQS